MRVPQVLALISAFVLTGLSSCSSIGQPSQCDPKKPKPNIQSFPLYPDAQQVQVKADKVTQVTTFQTLDSSEAVQSFYEDLLLKHGWTYRTGVTPEPNTFDFYWRNYCRDPQHYIIGTLTPRADGGTNVEITIRTIYPE